VIRRLAIVALFAIAGFPACAGELVDFTDITAEGSQPGLVHTLRSSADCSSCHRGASGEHHYPGNSWAGSMKANATRDPLFWAALDVANRDGEEAGLPGIGDFCLRCHSPLGWYGGRVLKRRAVQPVNGQVDPHDLIDGTDGCQLQGSYDTGQDYDGIGCHFCHRKLEQSPSGQPHQVANARVWIDDGDCGGFGEPCRAGPYTYPAPMPGGGEFNPPHAWEQRHFLGSAEACGSCHDVSSPSTDTGPFRRLILPDGSASGQDTGLAFPIERTYSEWLASDFSAVLFRDDYEARSVQQRAEHIARGASCRDCHMPQAQAATPGGSVRACTFGPPRTGDMPVHAFVGGNTWVPAILKGEYPGLGRSAAFDWTVARAAEMLSERSLRIEASGDVVESTSELALRVKLTNLAGHKLPTGYGEGRRMWPSVEVRDGKGEVLWRDGHWDPDTGELATSAQTRVYEIKQGIWDAEAGECRTRDSKGREAFHFVLNNCIAKDNRIPPAGFRGLDSLELRPVAHNYPETRPGSGQALNYDVIEYRVPLPAELSHPVSVTVRLHYQIASKAYVEFLRDQALERGFPAENALCADAPGRPFTVGPQHRSRGQYVHDLWSDPRYGRSPPTTMGVSSFTVDRR